MIKKYYVKKNKTGGLNSDQDLNIKLPYSRECSCKD